MDPDRTRVRKQKPLDIDTARIPPQAVDVEEAVLGAIMLERDAIVPVADVLLPEMFYKDSHQMIYRAIQELFSQGKPIDTITVTHKLRDFGDLETIGGPYFLTQLTNRVTSSANIEYHVKIITQQYLRRELIAKSSAAIYEAYDESNDILDVLSIHEREISDMSTRNVSGGPVKISELVPETVEYVEEMRRQCANGKPIGVRSGFVDLDKCTGGFQNGDFVIIAGRPSMGKTSVSLHMAKMAAQSGFPVIFYSLEMKDRQLILKYALSESNLPAQKLKFGNIDDSEAKEFYLGMQRAGSLPIWIGDKPSVSIRYIRATAKKLVRDKGVKMIVIDYLQLISEEGSKKTANREQEVSFISKNLKSLAKELDVPVIALSQLSRATDQRTGANRRPILSDLRESGSLEQEADLVVFIYRPAYYGIDQDDAGNSTSGLIELIIAKHRNGSTTTIPILHNDEFTKFYDIDNGLSRPIEMQNPRDGINPNQAFEPNKKQEEPF